MFSEQQKSSVSISTSSRQVHAFSKSKDLESIAQASQLVTEKRLLNKEYDRVGDVTKNADELKKDTEEDALRQRFCFFQIVCLFSRFSREFSFSCRGSM